MFNDNEDLIYAPSIMYIWFLLAFQGGALNTAGYLGVHRFISHLTGFATLAGVAGAQADWKTMFGMILVPMCFLVGVIISSWNTDRERIKHHTPKYTFIFLLIFFNLAVITILGKIGYLGEFGEPLNEQRDYFLLCLLSFTCGLQNAAITTASGGRIRTTHLTGPTTDFGINLVRVWSNRKNPKDQVKDYFGMWSRVGIYFSFIFGSMVSAYLFIHFKFSGFYLPLVISLYTAIELRAIHLKHLKKVI